MGGDPALECARAAWESQAGRDKVIAYELTKSRDVTTQRRARACNCHRQSIEQRARAVTYIHTNVHTHTDTLV